jgi:MutS domain V
MKAFLMHRTANFDVKAPLPAHTQDLAQDLELETIVGAMARNDAYLAEIARSALLQSTATDRETVLYRQAVFEDCLQNAATIRLIYTIAVDSLDAEKKSSWAYLTNYPSAVLRRSLEVMHVLVDLLMRLRSIADRHAGDFHSQGFLDLFATLQRDMDNGYFARIRDHLQELKFNDGLLLGAQVGTGLKGRDYVLLRSKEPRPSWIQSWIRWVFGPKRPGYTFALHPRDEGGFRALSELSDRGIDQVADALARSNDHIVSFFMMLRAELSFYVGCLNLHEELRARGGAFSRPTPLTLGDRVYRYEGLYDPCLALGMARLPVANDGELKAADLVFITGANQGGKSTYLRSMGLAQLMMQAGMFVAARGFAAPLCNGLFTHYKREEDTEMRSGKFDEELVRMSALLAEMHPNAVIFFNESFASTNEREGSEIAAQIVRGLQARHVRVLFVTHMFELAHSFFEPRADRSIFLRAERESSGHRSFKVTQGPPLRTSYGQDLYEKTFASRPGEQRGAKPMFEGAHP